MIFVFAYKMSRLGFVVIVLTYKMRGWVSVIIVLTDKMSRLGQCDYCFDLQDEQAGSV